MIAVIAWILWVIVALNTLWFLIISLAPGDPGGRWLYRVHGLTWLVGLVATAALPLSKFHLIWIYPVGAIVPYAIINWRFQRALNTGPFALTIKRHLEEQSGGEVWDWSEMRRVFKIFGGVSPREFRKSPPPPTLAEWWDTKEPAIGMVYVIRLADKTRGTLYFHDRPRFYFGWSSDVQSCDAFSGARYRFEQFQDAIGPYTARAKHRTAIVHARSRSKDAAAYEEAVAAYTDPADFAPYTEAELDAHTAAMENLTAAFGAFNAAFTALTSAFLDPDDEFYVAACACFNVYCETYAIAAKSYSVAALCAHLAAAEAKAQACKEGAIAWLHAPDTEAETTDGETKADLFLAKAKSAEAKAEEFCERVNEMIGTDST